MLKRKAEEKIKKWISGSNSALLVSGARQVGKTYSIRQSLRELGCNYVEINLIDRPELVKVLEGVSSVQDLTLNLSIAVSKKLEPGETIIFIDEAQQYKDIVTKIKFWVDEGSYRYILSGSLLGVELNNLRSAPVGYLEELDMYPLDFEEFLTASSVDGAVIDELRDCYENRRGVSEFLHGKLMEHFRRYLVVGGMPAAVEEYVDTGDLSRVMRIQKNIIAQYKRDFTKYENEEKRLMLIDVYEQVPSQLLKQNRRFNYSDIKKGLRFERVEDSFLWLKNAGVVISVFNATEPRVALNQNKKSSLLKLYMSDVGLLSCMYGRAAKLKLLNNNKSLNCGGIYENAVSQELNAHGYGQYFYNSHKNGELDFVIEHDNAVLPIEVKSGKDYYVHSAIKNCVENKEYGINEAYVLADCPVSENGKITYLPIYMCMFINEDYELPVLGRI